METTLVKMKPAGRMRAPAGVVTKRPNRRHGEVARWRHADKLPYVEVVLVEAQDERWEGARLVARAKPPCVRVDVGPSTAPLSAVTDPAEIEALRSMLAAAGDWLREQTREPEPPWHEEQLALV